MAAAEQPWAADTAWFRTLHDLLPEPFFQTQAFLTFAGVVLALYWLLPRRWNTARVLLLVFASLQFYAAWNAGLALLVLGTSLLDYAFARALDASTNLKMRKGLLLASVGMNLGVLGYFKYRGFFLNELHALTTSLGVAPGYDRLDPLALLVPFGISFYTFEAISYAVDVYRRRIRAERSLPHFLLFILFFPHLVAGPIVRAGDFLRQSRRIKRWNWPRVQVGLQLFLLGLFKKFAIADRMAVFADPVFADPQGFSTGANWLAVLAFSLRIYADFSGYSDMACGVAHFFGYKLARNFNAPYLAENPSDFWRRWHISLSTWLRDYAYIPLGGSRGGEWLIGRNLLIVMALGGLWHGAYWTYMLWGLYHGLLLIGHRLTGSRLGGWPGRIVTFVLVSLGWVLFRPEWELSLAMFAKLFAWPAEGLPLTLPARGLWWTALAVLAGMLAGRSSTLRTIGKNLPAPVLGVFLALALGAAQLLAPNREALFIYFTF